MRLFERLGRSPKSAIAEVADEIDRLWLVRNEAPEGEIDEIDFALETHALNAEGPAIEPNGPNGADREVFLVPSRSSFDFWESVTDVPCPVPGCDQPVVWFEAGFVPGYRACLNPESPNETLFEFVASGNALNPRLERCK